MHVGSDLDLFISDLVTECLAERTARLYASDVEAFFDSVEASTDELTPDAVGNWLETLVEQYASSTITRQLTSLRRYCRRMMSISSSFDSC